MRIKTFLIATLIIGAMTFPFRHNAMPVITHSASPATLTAAAAAAQGINPQAFHNAQITNFNPFSLLFGQNVMPGATHSALSNTLTATAAVPDFPSDGSNHDKRIIDARNFYSWLSRGTTPSPVETFYETNYCDEAWQLVNRSPTSPPNIQGPYQIIHSNTGTCVGVPSDGNGIVAVQTTCNAQSPYQLWYIGEHFQGTALYVIRNAHSGKYLAHGGLAKVKQYSFYAPDVDHLFTFLWTFEDWNGCKTSSGKCIAPSACPY